MSEEQRQDKPKRVRGPAKSIEQQLRERRSMLQKQVAGLREAERQLAMTEKALSAFAGPAESGRVMP